MEEFVMHEFLTTKAIIECPHHGRAKLTPSQHNIIANGQKILLETDTHIPKCPLSPNNRCIIIKWSNGSQFSYLKKERVKPLTKASIGTCYNANGKSGFAQIISPGQRKVLTIG